MWERRTFRFDPLLVLRHSSGEVDVRAFPISRNRPMIVTVSGFAIRARPSDRVRLYRTGRRYLALGPKDQIQFLSEYDCRAQFGSCVAVSVPCVLALETAVTGRGVAAVGREVVLAAFPVGAKRPASVGPAVWVPAPQLRTPIVKRTAEDPEPPPPARASTWRGRKWEPAGQRAGTRVDPEPLRLPKPVPGAREPKLEPPPVLLKQSR